MTDDKGIGIKGWLSGQKPVGKPQTAKPERGVLDKLRIAVLPFSNISPDSKDEYFADGMTEELISTLSMISGLRVIARTSITRYKATNKGVGEIGQELKVGTILEGSVRKSGDRLRATVQLIDASSEEHLWAQSFDREVKDVFAIQSDIARKTAEVLRVKLLKEEHARIEKVPTLSTEAHTFYLRGRAFWNERTEAGLKKANEYFERAIEADPSYALAHAGLADVYVIFLNYGYLDSKSTLPKAKATALKALELDELLAEAHASLAAVFWSDWDVEGSGRELERAIELNRSYATAHQWYSTYLMVTGHQEKAISEIMRAMDLDPLSPIIRLNIGSRLFFQTQQFERAIEEFRKALMVFPDYWNLHSNLGFSLIKIGRFDEGISELEKSISITGSSNYMKMELATCYALAGRIKDAKVILSQLIELSRKQYIAAANLALIYAALGERDLALQCLEKAYEERFGGLLDFVAPDSWLYNLMGSDPRFSEFLKKLIPNRIS